MRKDLFIIWSHGYDKKKDIIQIIKGVRTLNISHIFDLKMDPKIANFLFNIYKNENKVHILCKSKYLINFCKKNNNYNICAIVLDNSDPQVQLYGDVFKSKIIEELKILIRNNFNPKLLDCNKRIPPLNTGISHDHVIHSSDTEEEALNIIKFLNLRL
jgi:hypothetical protein